MKTKLWIMWAILGFTTLLAGMMGQSFHVVLGLAAVTALVGWIAFLIE